MTITTPIPIPDGPAVPNSNDPETTFDAQFEASLTWQRDELAPKANALAQATYGNALDAQASAAAAQASALASEASAVTSLAGSGFKGDWSLLAGALNRPASVAHAGRTWLLLSDLADVAAAEPGVSPAWRAYDVLLPLVHVTTAAQVAVAGYHYVLEYVGVVTLTLPAAAADGAMVWITVANGRYDNVAARNGGTVMGLAEDMQLDFPGSYQLRFITDTWRLQ